MRIIGGIVALIVLASSPAFADDTSEAKGHFQKGQAAYALGRYQDAAAEWEQAFVLAPDPALLYNAAQAHRLAGNHPRALQLYQNYLRLYGTRVKNQEEVKRHIAELQRAIQSQEQATHSPPTTPAPVGSTTSSGAVASSAHPPTTTNEPPTTTNEPPPTTTTPASPTPTTNEPATTTTTSAALVASGAPPPKPIYKKAWFWVAVGGAVVVVTAVGVGLGVGLSGGAPSASFGKVSF
jgi:tetratricopeptide (TPR) repeat protein